jgi:hypothetical protein
VAALSPTAQGMQEWDRGERLLLAPTSSNLSSLVPFATVADVLAGAAERDLSTVGPFRPRPRRQ